jgi:hypothetical protein
VGGDRGGADESETLHGWNGWWEEGARFRVSARGGGRRDGDGVAVDQLAAVLGRLDDEREGAADGDEGSGRGGTKRRGA